MHWFGKTEAVILIQLDFISLNYVLFLNYFSHFTQLILRKSQTFTEFSFGKHVIKVSFKLSVLLFTPADGYPSFPAYHLLILPVTPGHSGYCGLALFLALTLEGFSGVQHRYSRGACRVA